MYTPKVIYVEKCLAIRHSHLLSVNHKCTGAATVGVCIASKVLVEAKVLDPVCSRWGTGGYGPGDVGNTLTQQLTGSLPVELGEPGIVS